MARWSPWPYPCTERLIHLAQCFRVSHVILWTLTHFTRFIQLLDCSHERVWLQCSTGAENTTYFYLIWFFFQSKYSVQFRLIIAYSIEAVPRQWQPFWLKFWLSDQWGEAPMTWTVSYQTWKSVRDHTHLPRQIKHELVDWFGSHATGFEICILVLSPLNAEFKLMWQEISLHHKNFAMLSYDFFWKILPFTVPC